ncbi:hypothetical protein HF072_02395 [Bacillus sp. RO3]|nr:hypothetical protein [Bacillus sp. RO3]
MTGRRFTSMWRIDQGKEQIFDGLVMVGCELSGFFIELGLFFINFWVYFIDFGPYSINFLIILSTLTHILSTGDLWCLYMWSHAQPNMAPHHSTHIATTNFPLFLHFLRPMFLFPLYMRYNKRMRFYRLERLVDVDSYSGVEG